MDVLIVILAVVALVAAVDLAAVRFGTESRDGFTDVRLRQHWR